MLRVSRRSILKQLPTYISTARNVRVDVDVWRAAFTLLLYKASVHILAAHFV